jgi:hypothetical protein
LRRRTLRFENLIGGGRLENDERLRRPAKPSFTIIISAVQFPSTLYQIVVRSALFNEVRRNRNVQQ